MDYKKIIALLCLFLFTSIVVNNDLAHASNKSISTVVAKNVNSEKFVSNDGDLILRDAAHSKGKKVTMLKKGSKVFVYSTDENGWSYVKQGKLKGYTLDKHLTTNKTTNKTTSVSNKKPQGTGKIKGTVLWKYNDYVGVKGDAGASVYLFSKNATYPTYTKEQLFSWIDGEKDLKDVYETKVDVNGNYSFEDIPVGKYIGVISSKNTTRNISEKLQPNKTLKSLIGDFNYEIFEANRMTLYKHIVKEIDVKVDKTTDFSTDFGYTYF